MDCVLTCVSFSYPERVCGKRPERLRNLDHGSITARKRCGNENQNLIAKNLDLYQMGNSSTKKKEALCLFV